MNNLISNDLHTGLTKVFWITVAWTMVATWQFLIGYGALLYFNCDMSGREPLSLFKVSIFSGIVAGILGGSLMVFAWERWLRSKSYGRALLDILWSFTVFYFIVIVLAEVFYHGNNPGLPLFGPELWQIVASHLFQISTLHNYIFWLLVVLGTLVFLQVNDKYGPGTFRSFLMGKYLRPQREERIFMFLDLRSSTTIAEKIGERKYFNFLNDWIKHLTPAILSHKGEIYQYVGDEVVISWKMSAGTTNANCVKCFEQVQSIMKDQEAYYKQTYGKIPEFKAGLHCGYVMTGEIGIVKKDIAFSGDVLNTTSRIQAKCNELGVDILISKGLADQLTSVGNGFQPKPIGEMALRGKEHKLMLVTV